MESINALNQELNQITREDAGRILQALDNDFATSSIGSDTRADNYYFVIRALLVRVPGKLKDGLTFAQAAAPYILNKRRWRRPKLAPAHLPSKLAHTAHTNLGDLRQQVEKSLVQRKKDIEKAAIVEIQNYEAVFTLQTELLADQPPLRLATAINDWITAVDENDDHPFPVCTHYQFAAVVLKRISREIPPLNQAGWPLGLRLPRTKVNWSQLPQSVLYRHQFCTWPWFFAQQRLPNPVLTSIFLLILSHTGWNQGSVGSLTVDSITQLPQGGYRLQGYKGKTDDDTPISDVPQYLTHLCKAIDLLLWNYHQLIRLGLISPLLEKRVWFGWQRDNFKTTINVISQVRVSSLCTRNNIGYVVPSELRPIRAALAYLPQRDLEAVRVLLGHTDLTTSDSYLENTLFFRLNEAMMLEFQRRIEATITYGMGGERLVEERTLATRHVDQRLLMVPTGDGGACASFFTRARPDLTASDEPCASLECHFGNGCKHYRLIVDETTLEMALRSRLYYRKRWQTLYDANPENFAEMHLPKLLYMFVLLRIVAEQRPDLYAKAEAAII